MSEGAFLVAVLWAGVACAGLVAFRSARSRRRAQERLQVEDGTPGPELAPERGPFASRLRWLPWTVGGAVACVFFGLHFRPIFALAFAAIAGVLAQVTDMFRLESQFAAIEGQLGDAIDLMVGALRAGSGLLESIELASHEVESPLKEQLVDVTGKIRFGEAPQRVFAELTERVPLDTFKLFALTISVNWEVGGSIAQGLVTVGRTIRDKVELARRIRMRSTQARFSVIAVLGVTYLIGLLMWRNDPQRMEEFLATEIGANAMGVTLILQAAGLVWITAMSKIET
jgi:tight adherence protein B